jgi:hypothetical protein
MSERAIVLLVLAGADGDLIVEHVDRARRYVHGRWRTGANGVLPRVRRQRCVSARVKSGPVVG